MLVDSEFFDFTIRTMAWARFCDPNLLWPSAVRDDILDIVEGSAALYGLEDAVSHDDNYRELDRRLGRNCVQVQIDLHERLESSVGRTCRRFQSLPRFAVALAKRAEVPDIKLYAFIAKVAIWRRFVLECRGSAEHRHAPLGFEAIGGSPEVSKMVNFRGVEVAIPQMERKMSSFWDAYEQFYKCLELSLGPSHDVACTESWARYLDKVIDADIFLFPADDVECNLEAQHVRRIISGPHPGRTLLTVGRVG